MAPSTSTTPDYAKDEKVLCFHGELLYEAKVLDIRVKDPDDRREGYMFRVHYKGWKNTYVAFLFSRILLHLHFCFESGVKPLAII